MLIVHLSILFLCFVFIAILTYLFHQEMVKVYDYIVEIKTEEQNKEKKNKD